ncbi:MAG TPA: hypothetical protein EYG73_04910 [Arcobacter sp.]|nr:hypothetical protein [Arcobacter sp.]
MIKKLSNTLLTKENSSIYSSILLSLMLFTLWTITYALIIFKQFSWMQILGVSSVFIVIFSLFTYFFTDLFKDKFNIGLKNTFYAFLIFILMMLLFSTMQQSPYRLTFPLLETELGLGWHQDTAFHVSLIQSIMNFGYPSIAQHGVPFNLYHVLSHYVDALIVWVAQVDPYDSYMLLITFKKCLLVSSIAVFIAVLIKKVHPALFVLIFIFISPILTGTWHAIGSHSLWFTTILLIFSALKIFNLLISAEINNKDYYYFFIILILVTLGKISTGFMYASLVGFFLLLKCPKDKRVYILGTALTIFFWMYSKWFASTYIGNTSTSYDFSILSFDYYWRTIIYSKPVLFIYAQNTMVHIDIAILTTLVFIFKDKNTLNLLSATVVSYLLLVTLTGITVTLNTNDIGYFYLGFTYILNLFVFMSIVYNLQKYKLFYSIEYKSFYVVLSLISALYVASFYVSSPFPKTFQKMESSLKSINNAPFSNINKKLSPEKKISISKLLTTQVTRSTFIDFERPIYNFREKINQILINNKVSKKEALLFIPKEIYKQDISKFGGEAWANGMLLYAITGVPLLYAINNNKQKAYTQQDYNRSHLWKKSDEFSVEEVCKENSSKTIIQLLDFKNLKFNIYKCK